MKTYLITSPNLSGIISDDYLFFEGIERPIELLSLKEEGQVGSRDNLEILEKYFNDISHLFLRKITFFTSAEFSTDEEISKLQALFQEMIKIKKLIEGATRDADLRSLD